MARDNFDESKDKKKKKAKTATTTPQSSASSVAKNSTFLGGGSAVKKVEKSSSTTSTSSSSSSSASVSRVNDRASKSTFMGGTQTKPSSGKSTNTKEAAQNAIERSSGSTFMGGTQTKPSERRTKLTQTDRQNQKMYGTTTPNLRSKADADKEREKRRTLGQAQKSGDYDKVSELRGAAKPGSIREKYEQWDRDISDTVWHTIKQGLAADARVVNVGLKGLTDKDAFLYTTQEQRDKADKKFAERDKKLGRKVESETQAIQDIQDRHGYLGRQALSAVSSATGMGMDIAAGAIIPGSSLFHMWTRSTGTSLGEVNKKADNLRKQLKASGQYTDAELDEMFRNVDALDMANAGASGGIEVISELLFPGIGAARKVIGGKGMSIAERAGAKLFNKVGSGGLLKSMTRGTLEEVAEEEIGGPLQALASNLIYGNKFQGYNEVAIKRSLASESNALRSNIHSEADAQAAAARLSSKPFMDESINSYIKSGYSKEEATRLAELSRDYLSASLTGDVDTMKKYQDQMVKIMAGGENSQKQKFSLQDAVDAAVSTSMMTLATGAPSALSTMQVGNSFKENNGLDAVKQQAEIIKNLSSDTKDKVKAQAVIDHIDNGGDLSGTQVYEIIQKAGEAAQESKKAEEIKNRTAQVEMNKRDLRISPINPDGTLAPQTQQRFEQIVSDTVSRHETLARLSNNQDQAADFVGPEATFGKRNANTEQENMGDVLIGANIGAAFEVGAINAEMVNELARGSDTVKSVFREVTGIDVSQFSSYEEMNNSLMAEAANNMVNSARIEQVAWNDEARKQVSDYVRSDVKGSQGDLAIQNALESVDPRDRTQFLMTADVASNMYDFARHTEGSWNEARQMAKQMYPSVNANVLKDVFDAAKKDKEIAETKGYGKVVTAGKNMNKNSLAGAETAMVPGKYTDKRQNKEGATLTEESLAKNLVSAFGINIDVVDNLESVVRDKDGNVMLDEQGNPLMQQDNGMFIPATNTLVINANADATRTITQTIAHELTHHIAVHAPKEYVKLSRYIMDAWYRKDPEGFTRAIKARQAAYKAQKNQTLSDEQALEEIIADGAADFDWADEDFIADVTTKEPTLASRIIDAIKDVLQKIRNILASGDLIDERSREALYDKAVELDTVRSMWVKAAQTARKAQADQTVDEWQDDANRSSIRTTNDVLAARDDTAIFIKNTSKANYIDMIFNEDPEKRKTEETRATRTLDAFIGKEVAVTDGKKVYGTIVLGEPYQISAKDFHEPEYQKRHRVPEDDDYDVKDGKSKWSYPIESFTKYDEPRALSKDKDYLGSYQAREIRYEQERSGEISAGFGDESTRYSIREENPPKNTIKAYKVFVAFKSKPGELYPPMVASPGGMPTPVGRWVNADTGELARNKDGSIATNKNGRVRVQEGGKGTNKGKGGSLAWRPGWHLGSYPDAKQFAVKDPETGEPRTVFPENFIWAECEIAADNDYQLEALSYGVTEKGKFNRTQAGLPYIPKDGYYKYRTNADPKTVPWLITGAMKVNRILDDEEAREVCAQYGATPMKRRGGDIDLSEYGFEKGAVTPTSDEDLAKLPPAVDYSDEIRDLPGYVQREINFDDPQIHKELAMNGQDAEYYRALYEERKTGEDEDVRYSSNWDLGITALTGEPISQEYIDAVEYLENGGELGKEGFNVDWYNSLPEVQEARKRIGTAEETYKDNSPERLKMREKWVQDLMNYGSATDVIVDGEHKTKYNGVVRQGRRLDIIVGLPSSGKSSALVDPISFKYKSRLLDSDEAKKLIPEFDDGWGAGRVHEESSDLLSKAFVLSLERGDNIVMPIVGKSVDSIEKRVRLAKDPEYGYEVHVRLCDMPPNVAAARNMKRFINRGRFVDLAITSLKALNGPKESFDAIVEKGEIDGYTEVSNNVEKGRNPEFIRGENDLSYDWRSSGQGREGLLGNSGEVQEGTASEEPEVRYSVQASANAIGMEFLKKGEASVLIDADGHEVEEVTREMVINSPLGNILAESVRKGILPEAVIRNEHEGGDPYDEVDFVTDVMNMILKTQNIDMLYAISGTLGYDPTNLVNDTTPIELLKEKGSRFLHIRSNSENQYGTTVDFTTICVKTQAVIDAMSAVMKKRKGGLSKDEVINIVYKEVYNAGEQVPCPVCYVFSRWVGLGGIFDTMRDLQVKFPENMDTDDIRKEFSTVVSQVDRLIAESENSDKKLKGTQAREAYYKLVQDRLSDLDQIEFYSGVEALKDKYTFTDEMKAEKAKLTRELELLDAWSWLKNARLQPTYKPVPLDVLYDINAGKEFAESYPDSWKFRTTRGAGMGKAAVPYTPAILGNTIMGINSGGKVDVSKRGSNVFTDLSKNPFLHPGTERNAKSIKTRIANAVKKVRAQNVMNGQRLQSTSDFRFEYALDYLMNFLEFSALGAKAQLYTKVPEAVPFLASTGTECNCSIMALGSGIVENRKAGDHYIQKDLLTGEEVETDQPYSLVFSDVTGMAIEDALAMSQAYDNVQPILVAIGREHLITALANKYITMVIPYHSSGNTLERYQAMMDIVGESVEDREDFAEYESEHSFAELTDEQKLNREIRTKILTGKYFVKKSFKKPSEAEVKALQNKDNEYLRQLFIRFYGKDELGNDAKPDPKYVENFDENGNDADCYHVVLNGNQASVIMPHEYWDKKSTSKEADKQGEAYVKYCESLGYHPVFSGWDSKGRFHEDMDFTKYPGYWKTLIDRCMYNNDGSYHKQQAVRVKDADLSMITASEARKNVVKPLQVNDPGKTAAIADRIYNQVEAKRAVEAEQEKQAKYDAELAKRRKWLEKEGVYIESDAEVMAGPPDIRFSITPEMDAEYMDAVESDDIIEAQRYVDEAAKLAGFDTDLYHGTRDFGFTQIKTSGLESKSDGGYYEWSPFFATDSLVVAQTYSSTYDVRRINDAAEPFDPEQFDKDYNDAVSSLVAGVNAFAGIYNYMDYSDNPYVKAYRKVETGGWTLADITENLEEDFSEMMQEIAWSRAVDEADEYLDDYADELQESTEAQLLWDDLTQITRLLRVYAEKSVPTSGLGNYALKANTNNMMKVDAKGHRWNDIPFDLIQEKRGYYRTRELAAIARDEGYDGIQISNLFDDGGKGRKQIDPATIYIFFKPESQVRSADPATYAEDGSVIPLSERFDPEKDDIRYSLPTTDSDGNILTDGQMEYFKNSQAVDEQGRLVPVYHVTPIGGFTVFDPSYSFDATSISFSNSLDFALNYSSDDGNPDDWRTAAETRLGSEEMDDDQLGYYQTYLNMRNPLILEGDYLDERDIYEWPAYAKAEGYDGVIYRDFDDGADIYQVFSGNQVKDTRNENPTENPDIRYSIPPENNVTDYVNHATEDINDIPLNDPSLEQNRQNTIAAAEAFETSISSSWGRRAMNLDSKADKTPLKNKLISMMKQVRKGSNTDRQYKTETLDETVKAVENMYGYAKANNSKAFAREAWDAAERIVRDIDYNDDLYQQYKGIKEFFEDNKIAPPDAVYSDDAFYDFRKENAGRIKWADHAADDLQKDEIELASAYSILSDQYPDIFPADIEHPIEQLMMMDFALEYISPYQDAYTSEEHSKLVEDIANNLCDIVSEGKEFQAAINDLNVQAMRQRHEEALRKVTAERDAIAERERQRANMWKQRYNERVRKGVEERKAKADKREHLKSYGHIAENYNKLCTWVLNPTKEKNVPEEFRKALAEFLQTLDLQTENSKALEAKTGRTAQKTLKMRELKDRLNDLAARKGEDGASVWEVDASIAFLLDKLSDKLDENGNTIDALDADDIKTIDVFMQLLMRNIERYKQVKTETKMAEITSIGGRVVEFLKAKVDRDGEFRKRKGLRGTLGEINATALTPAYLFDRLGPLKEMYDVLRHNGFDTYIRNEKMIIDRLADILGQYYKTNKKGQNKPGSIIEEWRDERSAQDIELSNGKTITMSVAQMMSLRCLVKRGEQAMGHMMVGGIVVTPIQATSKLAAEEKEKKSRAGAAAERVKRGAKNAIEARTKGVDESVQKYVLSYEDIQNILAKLTPEQAHIADQLQELMSVDMARLGNEAHRELYGYEMFGEDNYFPIKVHGNERATDINTIGEVVEKIKSFGFTKPLTPKAGQAIEIDDIFSVVADHCNGMNLYNSYLVPITDFMKVLNYTHTFENGDVLTVKEAIEQAYGKDMLKYILNLMKDINGIKGENRGGLEGIMNKALGRAKRTAVFGNIRVALQQPTAIVRALVEINPKYLKAVLAKDSIKGLVPETTTKTMEELWKYCPIAQWKAWGYYDTYMGRDIEDVMMNTWSIGDKFLAGYYGQLDNATWSMIWMAVKAEQADLHKDMDTSSEEFLQMCGRRASEVFDKTQVVDSTFHRSDAMRSKQVAVKLFTAFMAEPTLTLNVFRAGLYNSSELRKEGKKGEANKVLAQTLTVIALQAAIVSAAQAFADAWRGKDPGLPWGDDDDDEEKAGYWLRWIHNFVYNLIDQAHLENNLYLVKDVTPYLNYMATQAADHWNMNPTLRAILGWDQDYLYSQNNLVFAGLENTANGIAQAFKKLEKGDEYIDYNTKEPKRWYDINQKVASGIGTFIGFPGGTLLRDFKPVWDFIIQKTYAADTGLMDQIAYKMGYQKAGNSDVDSEPTTEGSSYSMTAEDLPDNLTDEQKEEILKAGEKRAKKATPVEEQQQLDYDTMLYNAMKAAAGLEGEEYNKKVYSSVAQGLKGYVADGDYVSIGMMRTVIEQAGGDVEYFDQRVLDETKTAYKKTLKYDQSYEERNNMKAMYRYMMSHGMTQEQLSTDVLCKSDLARDMKVAYRVGDNNTIYEAMVPLVDAGITRTDLEKLYTNRNKMNLEAYKKNGRFKDLLKSTGTFIWPVDGYLTITSKFGPRGYVGPGASRDHPAIDIGCPNGTPISAADGGTVIVAGWNGGYGNSVGIKHDNGMVTYYNHLSDFNVKVGDTVSQGQVIAASGNTGTSYGGHLDFKVLDKNGKAVDPEKYLDTSNAKYDLDA